jgi:hypothetical protein
VEEGLLSDNLKVKIGFCVGLVFIIIAIVTYIKKCGKISTSSLVPFLVGIFVILNSVDNLIKDYEMKSIVVVFMWSLTAVGILIFGHIKKSDLLKIVSIIIWFIMVCYWFMTIWFTPLGILFGTYIPLINLSAITWILLAAMGFYYSVKVKFNDNEYFGKQSMYLFSVFLGLVSHFIVGGLLTFQVDNLWTEYNIKAFDLWLALSVSWGIYSLILFFWGAYTKDMIYKTCGSFVLIIVAIKTLIIDMSKAEIIYKIFALIILAGISFGITFINSRINRKTVKYR